MFELDTMVEAVTILAFAQRVIDDRNISLLMRKFYLWKSEESKQTPSELFEETGEIRGMAIDAAGRCSGGGARLWRWRGGQWRDDLRGPQRRHRRGQRGGRR